MLLLFRFVKFYVFETKLMIYFCFRRIANFQANKYFKLIKYSNRFVSNIVYQQLSLKGLICSQFPSK